MYNRKQFLYRLGLLGSSVSFAKLIAAGATFSDLENQFKISPTSDDFWGWVRTQYTVSSQLLNLNNGGVCPQPKVVQDALFKYTEMANEAPTYYLWRILDDGKEAVRSKLAEMLGADKEEVAINRNATEALDTIIQGISLKKGDEVVLSKYDYPRMMNAWKWREKRDGIVLKWVDFDFPENDPKTLIEKYTSLFTNKTKLVHLSHMINWSGQVIPVKEIAAEARKKGIKVLVDAAHTFAHLDFRITDWEIDYLGTSLHKWLCAPFGTGLLYVRKDEIKNIPAFFTQDPSMSEENIRKFEELGTRATTAELAIGKAIDFHHIIGGKRKQRRLYELKQYWVQGVKDHPRIKILTPENEKLSGVIGFVSIEGMDAEKIDAILLKEYKIHTVAIKHEKLNGLRISPHVYTNEHDLDRLIKALRNIANQK